MTRTVTLGPNGFAVSDDYKDLLSRFLNTNVFGDHADQLATIFAPDGDGFYIPSLGGATRLEDRDELLPPYDEDPALDPARTELWAVEREVPFQGLLQIVLTGDELRALLAEAQRLKAGRQGAPANLPASPRAPARRVLPACPRTISLTPTGFWVSDDRDDLLGQFLSTVVMGERVASIEELFAPGGEGFWIPSIGGAQRLEDRECLRPPYDADPRLDPEHLELWSIECERPMRSMLQIVVTGEELRALLAEAQHLWAERERSRTSRP